MSASRRSRSRSPLRWGTCVVHGVEALAVDEREGEEAFERIAREVERDRPADVAAGLVTRRAARADGAAVDEPSTRARVGIAGDERRTPPLALRARASGGPFGGAQAPRASDRRPQGRDERSSARCGARERGPAGMRPNETCWSAARRSWFARSGYGASSGRATPLAYGRSRRGERPVASKPGQHPARMELVQGMDPGTVLGRQEEAAERVVGVVEEFAQAPPRRRASRRRGARRRGRGAHGRRGRRVRRARCGQGRARAAAMPRPARHRARRSRSARRWRAWIGGA